MNWKRILVFILLSPIIIPILILIGFIRLFLLLIDGVEYAIEGEIDDKTGCW